MDVTIAAPGYILDPVPFGFFSACYFIAGITISFFGWKYRGHRLAWLCLAVGAFSLIASLAHAFAPEIESHSLRTVMFSIHVAMAILLVFIAGGLVQLPSFAEVERINVELRKEIQERERLEREQAYLVEAVQSSSDAVITSLIDGTIQSWNSGAQTTYGYSSAEAIGKSLRLFIPSYTWEKHGWAISQLRAGERVADFETRHHNRLGRVIDVSLSISSIHNKLGETEGFCLIIRNIGHKRQIEAELRRAEMRFQEIFHFASDAMGYAALDGRFLDVNPAYCSLTGYPREQMLSMRYQDLTSPVSLENEKQHVEKILSDGCSQEYEKEFIHRDGTVVPVLLNAFPVKAPDGTVTAIAAIIRDVSAQKKLERQLSAKIHELRRSNAYLEEFALAVSHDLQAPLRLVLGYLKLLRERYPETFEKERQQLTDTAITAAERMQLLIRSLLIYSRVSTQASPPQWIDSHQCVLQALNNLKGEVEASQAVVRIGKLPVVLADDAQLLQLFQNFVDNALKYRGLTKPKISIRARKVGAAGWAFMIADNGVGIAESEIPRLFHLFERLSHGKQLQGNGIGLAVCKKIIDRFGGKIWVRSRMGRGTRFFFTLPDHSERKEFVEQQFPLFSDDDVFKTSLPSPSQRTDRDRAVALTDGT